MNIAFYCPNKPLDHPDPSGDLAIAQGIHQALNRLGHDCREWARFRSRWFWEHPAGWIRAAAATARTLARSASWKPDLWLTYHTYYKAPDVIGPAVTRLLRIPYVLFQPIYSTKRRRDPRTRPGFYLNRAALRRACHAFTNNRKDVRGLDRILSPMSLTYLPPGIFPEAFTRDEEAGRRVRSTWGIQPGEPLLFCAARFRPGVKFRSLDFLLRSMNRLGRGHNRFRLVIAGDGPMEAELRKEAEELLPGKVLFAGKIPRRELFKYYSAADLFVFPGIGESLGMVYLEAQSCGCPVVALRNEGVSQVVEHQVTGFLVPQENETAFSQAVRSLLEDSAARREMGRRAADFVRRERNLHVTYRTLSDRLNELAVTYRP